MVFKDCSQVERIDELQSTHQKLKQFRFPSNWLFHRTDCSNLFAHVFQFHMLHYILTTLTNQRSVCGTNLNSSHLIKLGYGSNLPSGSAVVVGGSVVTGRGVLVCVDVAAVVGAGATVGYIVSKNVFCTLVQTSYKQVTLESLVSLYLSFLWLIIYDSWFIMHKNTYCKLLDCSNHNYQTPLD